MRLSSRSWNWLRLPGRIAMLLGLGALSVAGARADAPAAEPGLGMAPNPGAVLVRAEGGRIYLSEHGGAFEELRLGDTAEARLLRQLLESQGAAADANGIRLHPTILAGAGGDGFHGAPAPEGAAPRHDPPAEAGGSATNVPAHHPATTRKATTRSRGTG